MNSVETALSVAHPSSRGSSRSEVGQGEAGQQNFSDYVAGKEEISSESAESGKNASEDTLQEDKDLVAVAPRHHQAGRDPASIEILQKVGDEHGLEQSIVKDGSADLTIGQNPKDFLEHLHSPTGVVAGTVSAEQPARTGKTSPHVTKQFNHVDAVAVSTVEPLSLKTVVPDQPRVAQPVSTPQQEPNAASSSLLSTLDSVVQDLQRTSTSISSAPLAMAGATARTAQNSNGTAGLPTVSPNGTNSIESSTMNFDELPAVSVVSDKSLGRVVRSRSSVNNNLTGILSAQLPQETNGMSSDRRANVGILSAGAANANASVVAHAVQSNFQGTTDPKEFGGGVFSADAFAAAPNSSVLKAGSLPGDKPVWSQVMDTLISTLNEASGKSAASGLSVLASEKPTATVLKSLNLELQPGDLGTVKIELSLKNKNLAVELIAENANAADRIQASQDVISQKLKTDGYMIDQFVVKTSDLSRPQEAGRFSDNLSGAENKESEQSGSNEGGASGFGESDRRDAGNKNLELNEPVLEPDGRRDGDIYL